MKVFGKENNLGNKAKNIIKFYNNNFLIPGTIIIEYKILKNNLENISTLLQNNKNYILRPSFDLEDGENKSFAGYFKSIYPIQKEKIIELLNSNNIKETFNGKKEELKSIIIQEFIQTNIYGVYFTRSPENIFKKGFYEIGKTNKEITSGNKNSNLKLKFFQKIELEFLGKKLENTFNGHQDIEFCIKNGKIIILQTRNITTGNYTIYNFGEIKNFNGIYTTLDFDELGEKQDYFSYKILKNIFNCIYLDSKIYFKKNLFPIYLFRKIKTTNKNLKLFLVNYKKYLFNKILFNLLKIIIPQKLDKKVLINFFKNYNYNFLLEKSSNLNLNFDYNTNFITRFFLKTEKQKNISFKYLEKYKKEFNKNSNFFDKQNYNLSNKIIFLNGVLINKQKEENKKYIWIYKGKINGIIIDLQNFKYKKGLNQILIVENLDFNLYDKLDYINGLIVKNGSLLSHNSIILREYKIPSVIQYKDFNKLNIGENIILE